MPAVQLTTQVKSSTLYGRASKFFRPDGLLLFCIIMGLRSASSAMIEWIELYLRVMLDASSHLLSSCLTYRPTSESV